MDPSCKFAASPGAPLLPVSPERVNQQQLYDLKQSPSKSSLNGGQSRDSSVHDKVAAFNSLASQNKTLQDAQLKRAMLGREEAESGMRKLIKQVEESKQRERKVGERLESLMV